MADFPSTERLVIAWLRTQTGLEPALKETSGMWHIASRLRIDKLPFVVIQKLPGSGATGETPMNVSLVQIDAYAGNQKDAHQGKPSSEDGPHYQPDLVAAQNLALELHTLCFAAKNVVTSQGHLYGFENQDEPFRIPEEKLGLARYTFTTLCTNRLAT